MVAAVAAQRLALHADQLAPDRRRGRLHRRRLRGAGPRRRRPRSPASPARSRHASPGLRVRLAVGGDIDGFERYDDAIAAEDGADIDDPVLGRADALHVGHDRPAQGRRPGAGRAGRASRRSATCAGESRHLCTGPLYHAAPLGFSLASPLNARRRRRADGRLVGRGDAAPDRDAAHHPLPHGADDVPPAALAARRRARPRRRVVVAPRAARRGAVPGLGEAGDDRVVGPGVARVLRGHRRARHLGRSDEWLRQAGHGRQARSARRDPRARRRGPRLRARTRSARCT